MGLRCQQRAGDKQRNSGDAEKMEFPGLRDGGYAGDQGQGAPRMKSRLLAGAQGLGLPFISTRNPGGGGEFGPENIGFEGIPESPKWSCPAEVVNMEQGAGEMTELEMLMELESLLEWWGVGPMMGGEQAELTGGWD